MLNILNANALYQSFTSGQVSDGWVIPKNAANKQPQSLLIQSTGNIEIIFKSASPSTQLSRFYVLHPENKMHVKCDETFDHFQITNLTTNAINVAVTPLD